MANRVRAVIFDFDGLLMDTESTNVASWQAEYAAWGLELDMERFFAPHGGNVTEHRHDVLAAAVGAAYDREMSRTRRKAVRDQLNAALHLSTGIDAWLTQAHDAGLRTAVASSATSAWVSRHLSHVDAIERFELVVGRPEVEEPKPSPRSYRLALHRLGLDSAEAVAVEDTAHGVDAAHAAGMTCIAIPNPYVDPSDVGHADLVLRSAADCPLQEALARVSAAAASP
ncbi:MAG: HAD-IA family hydrolase [Nocardioides sp.]|nr:HAD-IA family hydrolase [Nocardioides sp.]